MITEQFLTSDEVLARGIELLKTPLPHEWSNCQYNLGPYCPRCAAAHATTELTTEHRLRYFAGDDALKAAVMYLRIAGGSGQRALSLPEAETIMATALERAKADSAAGD